MMIVLEFELKDFKNAISSKGLDPLDFELEQVEALCKVSMSSQLWDK